MRKPAESAFPLQEAIRERWSPRAFAETPPSRAELGSILEAGRWAASSSNEQPWRLIVGIKGEGDAWQRLFEALSRGNQAWCIRVPVLMVSVAVPSFRHNGQPNRHWQHDVGMARGRGPERLVDDDGVGLRQRAPQPVQVLMVVKRVAAGPVHKANVGQRQLPSVVVERAARVLQQFADARDGNERLYWVLALTEPRQ